MGDYIMLNIMFVVCFASLVAFLCAQVGERAWAFFIALVGGIAISLMIWTLVVLSHFMQKYW